MYPGEGNVAFNATPNPFHLNKICLNQENWDECFNQPSVDVASDMWTEKLLKIAYEFIPNKQIVVRPRDSPRFTSELRE